VDLYNTSQDADTLSHIHNDLDSKILPVLREDVEKIHNRGAVLKVIEEKTDLLLSGAIQYRKTARKVKNKVIWDNWKNCFVIGGVIFLLICIAALFIFVF
jgi:hypothetical protein